MFTVGECWLGGNFGLENRMLTGGTERTGEHNVD